MSQATGNDLQQTTLVPIINSQQLTSLGLNSIHATIVNHNSSPNGQIATNSNNMQHLTNNIHQQLPVPLILNSKIKKL